MNLIAAELAQTELFRGVPEALINLALAHAAPRQLVAGEVLLSTEQENQHIYLLLSGTLGVHFGSLDSPEIRELGKGVSVGEMSIFDGTLPSAYIVAKEVSRVFPIHSDLLCSLVTDTSPIAGNMLRMMTHWMKFNTQRIVKDRRQIWELTDHANVALRALNETLEQRIAERTQELSDAKQMLEISLQRDSHTRMKFLAQMSHEFRTPLNTVLGYAELLQRGSARVSVQEGVAAIKNSSRHLLSMIDDILDHVRGESGQISLRLAPVHWRNFIKSLEQSASMMLDSGNHFQLRLEGDMPEAVMVDELRLQAVLNNLLSNANRYTQDGRITFTCRSAAVDDGHRRFTFTVSDTGQGIATDEQKRIFEPFVRGTAGKSSGIDGVGIGLVIAQQLVALMGGEICVDSKPGHGSRFSFSIVCELAEAAPRSAIVPEHAAALEPRTILVVEDDENSRNLLAMLLEDYGFNVVTAKSGNDARQFLDVRVIDLVITDQFMPDGDGWSVLMDWSAHNIPLILLSATQPDKPENLPETLRFASVQLKPFDANTLLSAIGEILTVKWTVAEVHDDKADTLHCPPMELLAPLKAMIEQGAVTDITEWLEIFSAQYPQYRSYAARIATTNLTLDFKALRKLTT